jgi:glycosyltransferase involved in cell wall biosynthesis
MPEVSVIVPNYNHGRFLKQRLDSIFDQSFSDFEIIILDDCSTDNSRDIIESYRLNSKVSSITYNSSNSGSSFRQWKKGLSLAKGKYIWIAESDDYAASDFLAIGLHALKTTCSELFYCKSVQVDQNGRFLRDLHWWLDDLSKTKWDSSYTRSASADVAEYLVKRNFICNASSVIFLNTSKVDSYLQEVLTFRHCGDWLFWLQFCKDSRSITYSVDTINYWRDHASTTRAGISYERNFEMMKIYRWVAKNVLNKESFSLLKYFYKFHINKKPRSSVFAHLNFALESLSYSLYTPILVASFYISPKRFEV